MTLLSPVACERVFDFAIALGAAARLFTLQQLAQHPELSWRTQPVKRASEVLRRYEKSFEKLPGPHGKPFRWRLSTRERRLRGIRTPKVNPMSQKAEHWLGLGEVFMALTFHGGRPTKWITEPDHTFDVLFEWQRTPYLLEYQRSRLSERAWGLKWDRRIEWYRKQEWDVKPRVVLLNLTGQQDATIHLPRGTIHVIRVDDLPRKLQI